MCHKRKKLRVFWRIWVGVCVMNAPLLMAAELINLSISPSVVTPGAVENYRIQYHLAQPVEAGGTLADIQFPAGYQVPTLCGINVVLRRDGQIALCPDLVLESPAPEHLIIRDQSAAASGTRIELTLDGVQNSPVQGRYFFQQFQTSNSANMVIDKAVPLPALGDNIPPVISGVPASTVAESGLYRFSPVASDAEGHTLTFFLQGNPDWLAIEPVSGEVFGVPKNKDVGLHTGIRVGVTDGFDSVTLPPFSVRVSDVNQPPVIQGVPQMQVDQDVMYQFQPHAFDPDGDPVQFRIQSLPPWAEFDTQTGQLFGTPSEADVGLYQDILLSVSDGELSADLPAFSIEVSNINDPPLIRGSPALFVMQDAEYLFIPDVQDTDTSQWVFSVLNLPSWMHFDTQTGVLQGVPSNADVGMYSGIQISVSDGDNLAFLPPFNIEVINVNDAPEIAGLPASKVTQDSPYLFTPQAKDIDADTLRFAIFQQPPWASFDNVTGTLSGVPQNADVGVYDNIEVQVSDGELTTSLPAFSIEVINRNDAPRLLGSPITQIAELQPYAFLPVASDPDEDVLLFSVQGLPAWASFNELTGALEGTPSATDQGVFSNIIISVTDGVETVSLPPFSITVVNVNQAPGIEGADFALVAGSRVRFTPDIHDVDNDPLVVEILQPPQFGQLSLEDHIWVYDASFGLIGNDSFSLIVSDGQLSSPPALFNVAILPVQALAASDVILVPENPEDVYLLDVLQNDTANTNEILTLVASFSIFGDAFIERDLIRLVLNDGRPNYITLDYIVENENGQQAVAQAVLVIQN